MSQQTQSTEVLVNRKWTLVKHPEGNFHAKQDAKLQEEKISLQDIQQDEALIQVHTLGIDAFIRTMLDEPESDAYHGAVGLGSTIPSLGIGTVISCPSGKLKKGRMVMGMMGAQTVAKVPAASVNPVLKLPCVSPQISLNLLGVSGLTAYAGMNFVLKPPKKGETVVVSAAAGATGSIAAQLAKHKGARVVGIAGGPEKKKFLLETLQLDAAIDYKDKSKALAQQLDEACPDGIDFFFDNVGGTLLDLVLERLNKFSRIVICGAVSQYGHLHDKTKKVHGPSNYLALAEKTSQMAGFVVLDFGFKLFFAVIALLWLYFRGAIKNYDQEYKGIEQFPEALEGLFQGKNKGKPIVTITESS